MTSLADNLLSTFKQIISFDRQTHFYRDTLTSVLECTSFDALKLLIAKFCVENHLALYAFLEINLDRFDRRELFSFPYNFIKIPDLEYLIQTLSNESRKFKSDLFINNKRHPFASALESFIAKPVTSIQIIPLKHIGHCVSICIVAHNIKFRRASLKQTELILLTYHFFSRIKELKKSNERFAGVEKILHKIKQSISRVESGFDFDLIMKMLAASVFDDKCKCAALWLYNRSQFESGKDLVLRYFSDVKQENLKSAYLNIDDSLTGISIKSRHMKYYPDARKEKKFNELEFAKKKNLYKLIVFPLFDLQGEPIGALNIYPDDCFETDESILMELKSYISALELTLEMFEMQEKLITLDNVVSFSQKTNDISSEEEFFEKLVLNFQKGDIIEVEGVSIFITQPKMKKLKLIATTGVKKPWKKGDCPYSFGEGLTGSVAKQGCSIIENNLQKLKKGQEGKVIEKTINQTMSWIGIPIKNTATNEVVGVIRCVNKRESGNSDVSSFTVLDQNVLEFIGFISAQIIQSLRIFKDKEDALKLKEEILKGQEEFNRSISHEIIIPVNSILGRVGLLKKNYDNTHQSIQKKVHILFEDIEIECSHIDMISRSYSVQDPVLKKVNIVKEIVQRTKYVLERIARINHIDIYYSLPKNTRIPHFSVDKSRMLQVMYNLVNNAIKYANKNSDVEITIKPEFNGDLTIMVSNEGIGIPKSDESKIFDRSFRALEAKKYHPSGRGMGLYYSKKIIETDHEGLIWVERGTGPTEIAFKLPAKLSL